MKYCNRCGALLIKTDAAAAEVRRTQKRLDNYLDGLFWVTVIGLGVIIGGLVVLKKFGFPEWVWIFYLSLSLVAFLINFVINLLGSLKMMGGSKQILEAYEANTTELNAADVAQLPPVASVTENTTRTFEPVIQKRS